MVHSNEQSVLTALAEMPTILTSLVEDLVHTFVAPGEVRPASYCGQSFDENCSLLTSAGTIRVGSHSHAIDIVGNRILRRARETSSTATADRKTAFQDIFSLERRYRT